MAASMARILLNQGSEGRTELAPQELRPYMAAHPVQALPAASLPRARTPLRLWPSASHATVAALLLPSVVFLAAFFAFPALGLLACSFLTQAPNGTLGRPLTLDHYRHFFDTSLYTHVLLTTLRISLVTTGVGIALGYPIALVMVRTNPVVTRLIRSVVSRTWV
jgi:ABC-type spermidine/putrescine transport system permease subunit I